MPALRDAINPFTIIPGGTLLNRIPIKLKIVTWPPPILNIACSHSPTGTTHNNNKINKLEDAEIYYVMGLEISPNHLSMNEHLGKLYVETNRIKLAKERLDVLKSCNCQEYEELKAIIASEKVSKY